MDRLHRPRTDAGVRSACSALGALAVGLLTACSSGVVNGNTGDPSNVCTQGMQTCVGNVVNVCNADGIFTPTTTCAAAMTCDNSLGCVECTPGVSTCVNNEVHSCSTAGTIAAVTESCAFGQTCKAGACVDSCELAASDFVYLVDSENVFWSFAPKNDKGTSSVESELFTQIGTLKCPTVKPAITGFGLSPFSMAVDRHAVARVLYTNGEIFQVSPQNAACTATAYQAGQQDWQVFGMGYVSDAPGAKTDTLYIGRALIGGNTDPALGKIDSNLVLSRINSFTGVTSSPEMSGTAAAELYGYFPSNQAGKHVIALIDRTTAAFTKTYQLDPLPSRDQGFGYAFAQWGGRFYYFISMNLNTGNRVNRVYRYDPVTNMSTLVLDNSPHAVVGAGVSTCAPAVPIG